jgi:hypothetical protein
MQDEVLASVSASTMRRMMGLGMVFALGAMLVWMGVQYPGGDIGWRVFLLALGAVMLWLGEAMRRATLLTLELTATQLRDSSGTVLAEMDQVVAVTRGAFAMKPSHGFSLTMRAAQGRRWLPGLWWRMGRRVGVGGVTPGSETKYMSDIISAMLAERG